MKNNKITAVYVRTSSTKQNYDLQLMSARPYLKGVEPESVNIFLDIEISGDSQPEGLLKLIDLISKAQVDTLIIYDRNRLTNSVDLYLELVNLIHRHKVKVIFTAAEEHQLGDIYTEGLNVLFRRLEGIKLSNRVKEGIKRKQNR